MHDLPQGPALLDLAREVLLNDLLPLLPEERRLEARLVANCMAIAAREAEADRAHGALFQQLEELHRPLTPALSPPSGEREGPTQWESEGHAHDSSREAEALRRFACELRIGGFENSPEQAARARAILWRMTIAKLRLANPRFLAANGFA
jgi:hypothetical protein